MAVQDIRHLPVVNEDDQVIGLVSQRDMVREALAPAEDLALSSQHEVLRALTVHDVMTRDVAMV